MLITIPYFWLCASLSTILLPAICQNKEILGFKMHNPLFIERIALRSKGELHFVSEVDPHHKINLFHNTIYRLDGAFQVHSLAQSTPFDRPIMCVLTARELFYKIRRHLNILFVLLNYRRFPEFCPQSLVDECIIASDSIDCFVSLCLYH